MTDQATLEAIDKAVKQNDVVLFMKGTPTFPQCGFSSTVVQILDYLGVEYVSTNVLESTAVREGIKQYNIVRKKNPTPPQTTTFIFLGNDRCLKEKGGHVRKIRLICGWWLSRIAADPCIKATNHNMARPASLLA